MSDKWLRLSPPGASKLLLSECTKHSFWSYNAINVRLLVNCIRCLRFYLSHWRLSVVSIKLFEYFFPYFSNFRSTQSSFHLSSCSPNFLRCHTPTDHNSGLPAWFFTVGRFCMLVTKHISTDYVLLICPPIWNSQQLSLNNWNFLAFVCQILSEFGDLNVFWKGRYIVWQDCSAANVKDSEFWLDSLWLTVSVLKLCLRHADGKMKRFYFLSDRFNSDSTGRTDCCEARPLRWEHHSEFTERTWTLEAMNSRQNSWNTYQTGWQYILVTATQGKLSLQWQQKIKAS